jgi:superfamily II DNA or RNA helicase
MLQKYSQPLLLIVDEVHNMGPEELRSALLPNATFRLGLSATPERWFDPTGTTALEDYFGPTLVHYTLRNALDDGVLCQYRYYPVLVSLTDEEFDAYYDLTVRIARLFGSAGTSTDRPERLESLLIRRARLIGTAYMKLDTLRHLISPLKDSTHNLVYCGDGTVEAPIDQSVSRQIDAVTRLLGTNLGMTTAKYIAETSLTRRNSLRRQFAAGDIQCLVAIRCLDEGVDIPETRRAFILASSTNPRQFIQRRGRLLRTARGKQFAEIYDFVVEPPEELTKSTSQYYSMTRRLFGKELGRVIEFASLAVNGPEALGRLLDIRNRMNLLDMQEEEYDA